jgi:hypothetical protein
MTVRKLTLSLILVAVVSASGASLADAASSWDGVWTGYWKQRSLATIIVQNGIVVSPKRHIPRQTQVNGNVLSYEIPGMSHVSLTRTGENTATAVRISTFNGRRRTGSWDQMSSGAGAGSSGGLFARQ